MNKHDEGYVLAYVTVVLLLFSLIATMILTGAMKNLTNQQDTIARMEDQYAAAGMIEQAVAMGLSNAENDELLDEEGNVIRSLAISSVDEGTQLVAQSGSVVITCVIDSAGNYVSYVIGGAIK